MLNLAGDGDAVDVRSGVEVGGESSRDVKRRRLADEGSSPAAAAARDPPSAEAAVPTQSRRLKHICDYIKEPELRMTDMILIRLVGRGAFGEVWLAQDYKRDRFVALKKYYYGEDRDGFNKACLREICLLQLLGDHPNIVPFHGVIFTLPSKYGPVAIPHPMSDAEYLDFFQKEGPYGVECGYSDPIKAGLWLAFDFYPYDLNAYMRSREEQNGGAGGVSSLPLDEVKMITHGILKALEHCHRNHILHRDIKSANILLDFEGNVKLADFGLARQVANARGGVLLDDILAQPLDLSCEMDPRLTNKVVTLWYRSPELLLGSREYTASSDIWSLGCLVYEMLAAKPLFSATNEQQMIQLIFEKMPLPPDWTEAHSLPLYGFLKNHLETLAESQQGGGSSRSNAAANASSVAPSSNGTNAASSLTSAAQNLENMKQKVIAAGGAETWDFMSMLLSVNPAQRCSAADALKHPWLADFKRSPSQKFKMNMEQGVKGNSVTVRKERERLMTMQKQNIVRHFNSSNVPPANKRLEEILAANKKLQDEIQAKQQLIQELGATLLQAHSNTPAVDCQLEEGELV